MMVRNWQVAEQGPNPIFTRVGAFRLGYLKVKEESVDTLAAVGRAHPTSVIRILFSVLCPLTSVPILYTIFAPDIFWYPDTAGLSTAVDPAACCGVWR